MDQLQAMRVLVKVVEHGSFIRAAQQLELSAAVVTRHIADLESHLGTRLLNRTTRKLSLTEAGEKYLASAIRVLQEVDEADTVIMSQSRKPTGTLHIYSQLAFGESQLANLLNLFRKQYPDIGFDITLTDRTADLVEEGFDIGFFLSLQKFEATMIARQLGMAEVILCASPGYIQHHGLPASPEELMRHTCLNFSYERIRHHWTIEGPQGVVDIPIKSNMVSNNAELLRQAATEGMGIVMRPSFALHDDLATGRLVRLLPEHQIGKVAVFMVYPSRRFLPAKVSCFVEFINAHFPRPETDHWTTCGNASLK